MRARTATCAIYCTRTGRKGWRRKTRYAHRPRGLAATAGATSYGLLRPKVSKASEKKSLLRPTEIGTSGNVNGNTSPAKLAPPFRGAGSPTVPTSHNVLKKRDPRILSTPGPVSISSRARRKVQEKNKGRRGGVYASVGDE